MNKSILEVKHLTKIYSDNNRGVNDINISITKGQFHALIGQNGSGKTTVIKSIIGAYSSFEGEILINGISNRNPFSRESIAFVPEKTLFPSELTTYEYLKWMGIISNVNKDVIEEKITTLLNKFNINDLRNDKPVTFSSGQKKKVLLIQALLNNPQLIILDEPAANLDPSARYELFQLLNELHANGVTILIISHILSEIDKYVTDFTLIDNGKVIYSGVKNVNLESFYNEKVIKS
ncbi:ABC transporter ATP-binding protein [Mycoplasma phocimorsus]|uniref:ABC transporter ATP-binding protein n=1 Tax=Mycoplasma phocimorsus TaxID=3045839 RepID=A0AAJ1UWI5_9MOLU|nr:ABC transporter ATP-binding protein [Mycoplasma phocimorsus]MDJ1645672.1 ABC transporter ATP-binding protein [Mycoplasma phocimorsus]MDJ1646194.1 ABC transporter ATP-binding protein [Mycoplasma phocimorsus]MDJ1646791.1 ABC transporter ATP-binding protein [Mycoplasma phocimorsus]MDJ1647766.1 ABC transporter ATP-binding protein [Mycoplasma phocimorsus]MDJ1648177.1 ABC transporter ATP-binding protein [Mycoplasma phocimorsus]